MEKQAVIEHFGSYAEVARLLGISRQAVHKWPDVIPFRQAYRIEKATGGELKLDDRRYEAEDKS